MSITTPQWRLPARSVRTFANRLAQISDPELAEYERRRFEATRCRARTRRGTACARKGLANGRCRNHGGMATGPRTPEGKLRALRNLRQFRDHPELLEGLEGVA